MRKYANVQMLNSPLGVWGENVQMLNSPLGVGGENVQVRKSANLQAFTKLKSQTPSTKPQTSNSKLQTLNRKTVNSEP